MKLHYQLTLLLALLFSVNATANSAQPGLWNAGGSGSFSLLFPEDSTGFKKVQMAEEKICIQLYNGFAVIKGTYWMYNTSDDTVKIKSGYPINSYFDSDNFKVAGVQFDDLYKIKVKINGENETIWKDTIFDDMDYQDENWYVWNSVFPPKKTTKFEVYFIVNTSNAIVRQGYSTKDVNGFVYLLETGANWKQPILKGQIIIQLMDGLDTDDIYGIRPDSIFTYQSSDEILKFDFTKLSPTWENNIVINYAGGEDFDFSAILSQSDDLFKKIEDLDGTKMDSQNFEPITFDNPFHVPGSFNNPIAIIFWVVVAVLALLFIGLPLFIILRKRKKMKG